jgi:hypothetical protein
MLIGRTLRRIASRDPLSIVPSYSARLFIDDCPIERHAGEMPFNPQWKIDNRWRLRPGDARRPEGERAGMAPWSGET